MPCDSIVVQRTDVGGGKDTVPVGVQARNEAGLDWTGVKERRKSARLNTRR